jgi:DNA-binding transcriptional LysR family regulator
MSLSLGSYDVQYIVRQDYDGLYMDHNLELRHLRYFVAVAEELHFARAAKRLHLSQPPLSQQIRKMEDILGFPLFVRTSRLVKLTSAGEALLERARRTLRNVQRDIEDVRSVGAGEVGSLNVGFVSSAMLTTLPQVFSKYRDVYPRVNLRLYEGFTSMVLEGLENGTMDAGILRDSDPSEALNVKPLFSEPFVAVVPVKHPCAKQKSISARMLRNEPFVYYPRAAGARAFEKPLTIFEEHGFRPHIVQEASHWLSILRLVGAGLGVSVAPACVRRMSSPGIVCLPIRDAKIVSNIEIAWMKSDSRPIVEHFVQIALSPNKPSRRVALSRHPLP